MGLLKACWSGVAGAAPGEMREPIRPVKSLCVCGGGEPWGVPRKPLGLWDMSTELLKKSHSLPLM